MKHSKIWLLMLLCISQYSFSRAQNKIQIKISDKKTHKLLMGANAQWLNSPVGATSDEHGKATLELPDSLPQRLIVSYVGYVTDTIVVNHHADLDIHLEPEIQLSEVAVKARKQSSYISSIDPMKTEKISNTELKKA